MNQINLNLFMRSSLAKYSTVFFLPLVLVLLFTQCSESLEERLGRIAKEIKGTCPQMMDEYSALVDCEALPARTLKFSYTLKGNYDEKLTGVSQQDRESAMKNVFLQRLKQWKDLEFYQASDVRFEHVFFDANKYVVMHINIEAIDYK